MVRPPWSDRSRDPTFREKGRYFLDFRSCASRINDAGVALGLRPGTRRLVVGAMSSRVVDAGPRSRFSPSETPGVATLVPDALRFVELFSRRTWYVGRRRSSIALLTKGRGSAASAHASVAQVGELHRAFLIAVRHRRKCRRDVAREAKQRVPRQRVSALAQAEDFGSATASVTTWASIRGAPALAKTQIILGARYELPTARPPSARLLARISDEEMSKRKRCSGISVKRSA
jgi:hypothetical protein